MIKAPCIAVFVLCTLSTVAANGYGGYGGRGRHQRHGNIYGHQMLRTYPSQNHFQLGSRAMHLQNPIQHQQQFQFNQVHNPMVTGGPIPYTGNALTTGTSFNTGMTPGGTLGLQQNAVFGQQFNDPRTTAISGIQGSGFQQTTQHMVPIQTIGVAYPSSTAGVAQYSPSGFPGTEFSLQTTGNVPIGTHINGIQSSTTGLPLGVQGGQPLGIQGGFSLGNQGGLSFGTHGGISLGSQGGVSLGNQGGLPQGIQGGIPLGYQGGLPLGSQGGFPLGGQTTSFQTNGGFIAGVEGGQFPTTNGIFPTSGNPTISTQIGTGGIQNIQNSLVGSGVSPIGVQNNFGIPAPTGNIQTNLLGLNEAGFNNAGFDVPVAANTGFDTVPRAFEDQRGGVPLLGGGDQIRVPAMSGWNPKPSPYINQLVMREDTTLAVTRKRERSYSDMLRRLHMR